MLGPRPRPPLVPFGSASDPDWATSDDFAAFDRNADAILSPRLERRPGGAAGFRTLEYRPERDGVGNAVPLLQRAAQGSAVKPQPTDAQRKAAAEADAFKKRYLDQWRQKPQDAINSGRFFREQVFGAVPDKNNILQDPIGQYDPVFAKVLTQALQNARPEEVKVLEQIGAQAARQKLTSFLPGQQRKQVTLTPEQKRQFVTMVDRAGPEGQHVASVARKQWGLDQTK